MSLALALSIMTNFGLTWLWLKSVRNETKANERADHNEATAKEIKRQAEIRGMHITDDDVIRLLSDKAANKRKREAKS